MADLSKPAVKPIFPRKDTLQEVEEHLKSQLPINTANELTAALALHHNTMLHVLGQEKADAS